MTQNQINWAKLQEDIRHNRTGEVETNRTNLVNESLKKEANAINWGNLSETKRHNQTVEHETNRHNWATEQQAAKELFQRQYEYESSGKDLNQAETDRRRAQADLFNQQAIAELLKRDQIGLQKEYLIQQILQAKTQGLLNSALMDKAISDIQMADHKQTMDWLNQIMHMGGQISSVLGLFI